jgi:ABC-2 type transport system permease protein
MIADVLTVMWKEWKEMLSHGVGRGRWTPVVLIGVFGVLMPLQSGRGWLQSPQVLLYWAWVPVFLVSSIVADAFAGERERHTLETLLASRLSDRAILLGKTCAAVSYGWGLALVSLLLGLITLNVSESGDGLLMYPGIVGLGAVGLSLLSAWLAAGAGVLISLRAATVRQAQQTLSIATLVVLFIPVLGIQALPPEGKTRLYALMQEGNMGKVVAIAAAVLVALDAAFIAAAMARFQRARLILD